MSESTYYSQANATLALVEQIKPILAGKPREIQSAALAELLALHLAGICIPGDYAATEKLRGMIFSELCLLVTELIELNSKILGTDG